jgi:transcriptional regulator with XRE-family HTH domain
MPLSAFLPPRGGWHILNIENDRGNPKFEVLCQIIAYLHIPADQIFHPATATDGLKKQKLLLMLQECDEQEAAEILPAIEYLLALIHKRGNSND